MGPPAGWRTRGAAIIAAMILLASPARAGCNPSDIFNAAKDTFSGLASCAAACADGVGCGASAFLASALSGVAAQAGQGAVDSFCSQVQGLNDVNKITDLLKKAGASSIDEVANVLNSVGSLSAVVKCACDTEQGAGSLGSDIGACMETALCWLQDQIFGEPCNCTRPPPQVANCAALDPSKCQSIDYIQKLRDPTCIPSGNIGNSNPDCQNYSSMARWQYTFACTTTAEGTLVEALPPSAEGTGCNPVYYCFCPAPMKPQWHEVANPGKSDRRYAFSCDCPDGTHPGATMPNGISSCLCDNTNQPANFGFAPFGMCPPPACPAGQTRLGGVGDCVTPCSDPKQGMAFDGSCCDPAQMTSCGECCPPSTVPDPKSGTCVPRPQQPK